MDLTLGWDIRPAAQNDELEKALDYAKVAATIDQFAAEACFELVETFAERLAQRLMSEFGIVWLRLRSPSPASMHGPVRWAWRSNADVANSGAARPGQQCPA